MEQKIVTSTLTCPKCKSNNLILIEVWDGHTISWVQENSKFDRHDGNIEYGSPHHLEAKCTLCSYQWKTRKKYSIDYIISES